MQVQGSRAETDLLGKSLMQHWVTSIFEDAFAESRSRANHVRQALRRLAEIFETDCRHHFRTQEMADLADEIACCDNPEAFAELMWKVAIAAGFQNYTVFLMQSGNGAMYRTRATTSHSQDWIDHYRRMGYQAIDPVLKRALTQDGWFLFSDLPAETAQEEAFWADLEAHRKGRNGVCFAMTRADGARIAVTFSTSKSDDQTRMLVKLDGYDLKFIAEQAADCFICLSAGPNRSDCTLSIAELRFLHKLATSPRPEEAFTITAGFGSNKSLQASIRQKLKVDTIFQAVAIASMRKWFDQLPVDNSDVARSFPELAGRDLLSMAQGDETPDAA
jgi:hypothetical protein